MNDQQLLRYSRQINLNQVGYEGQEKLAASHALIIGLGGLGSPAAMYLAAAGVGRLTLLDFDQVDLSNLQRQIVHRTADIGRPKVESARDTLRALNPEVRVDAIARRADEGDLDELVAGADVVLDCCDNFDTRFAINAACARARKPLVSGAALLMEGQVAVFHHERSDSPCYQCLYQPNNEPPPRCAEAGVLAPVVGIIGSVQATEAIKVLLGIGQTVAGRLLLLDALAMEWRSVRLRQDPRCPVCQARQARGA